MRHGGENQLNMNRFQNLFFTESLDVDVDNHCHLRYFLMLIRWLTAYGEDVGVGDDEQSEGHHPLPW